jgi:hypothetical protein
VCGAGTQLALMPSVNTAQCATPCASSCGNSCPSNSTSSCCAQDVCIDQSASPTVTVTVGYNFVPLSPLMQVFFPNQTCFTNSAALTGSESAHTLCAHSTGTGS